MCQKVVYAVLRCVCMCMEPAAHQMAHHCSTEEREEGSRKTAVRFARMPGCLADSNRLSSCSLSWVSDPVMQTHAIDWGDASQRKHANLCLAWLS